MLANIALAGIYGYLAVRREVILFQKRAAEEAEEMGPVIEKLLADALATAEGDRDIRGIARAGSSSSQQQPLQHPLGMVRYHGRGRSFAPQSRRAADLDRHPGARCHRDR